jgi:hypothetical protein
VPRATTKIMLKLITVTIVLNLIITLPTVKSQSFINGIPQQQLSPSHLSQQVENSKCEPLNTNVLQLCKNIAYNETRFPNFMKQNTQEEAAADTAFYLPLIRINCSPVLKLFLCTLYAPPCVTNYTLPLKPCREMCEKAKSGCEDYMTRFKFSWPEYIDCWRFPSFNGAEACVTDDSYSHQQFSSPFTPASPPALTGNSDNYQLSSNLNQQSQQRLDTNLLSNLNPQQQQFLLNLLTATGKSSPTRQSSGDLFFGENSQKNLAVYDDSNSNFKRTRHHPLIKVKFPCPAVLQILSENKNTHYLTINDENVAACGMPCDNHLFTGKEVTFARSWVLIWSSICFISTLFTILTFLIETSRFRYPERPIIFLSGCYLVVALAYLIGSSSQDSIVCQTLKNAQMEERSYLVQGVEHVPCTLLFMMLYFFGMSSSIWWVVLTLTWFLAAGLKWGHEAIENIASYFHLAAWAIPGVKLIAILWLQRVEADVLSGVCYTGLRNINIMRGFVVAPLFLYLILGTLFLLAGFISLFRIRNVMKHGGNKTEKLEKFMIRIGVFSILYMVPAIIVICCYFYEQSSFNAWINSWLKRNQIKFNLPPDYQGQGTGYSSDDTSSFELERNSLTFFIFMSKYAMLLVVGITSGFWIWSHKTISSWQRFFDKLSACLVNLKPKYKNEAAV